MTTGMKIATNGGNDGSSIVSRSIIEAKRCLKKNGKLLLLLPHWSNIQKARALLQKNYMDVTEIANRQVEFFPITKGRPNEDTVRYVRELAKQKIIKLNFECKKPSSTVSVIQAIKI